MSEIIFLNGDFIPKEEAKISPEDRGFNFADGVYEVVKYYSGVPFRWDDHINRLRYSLNETGINFNDLLQLKDVCNELIKINRLNNGHAAVYLQITRGTHKRIHSFPEGLMPTVYASVFEMPSFKTKLKNGVKVITHEDIRWLRCDIKSVSLLPNTMLFQKAAIAGADECILIRNGMVTEATHSSVFGIKNGTIYTHPQSRLILPGITRMAILEICLEQNIPISEQPISKDQLLVLDEFFLSGTGSEILPVIMINDSLIGKGKPGPLTRIIQKEFFQQTCGRLGHEICWWDWD